MNDNNDLWQKTKNELQLQMTQATFETWLRRTTGQVKGNTLTVTVTNKHAKEWLEARLLPTIHRTVTRLAGRPTDQPLDITFRVQTEHPAPGGGSGPAQTPEPTPGSIDTETPFEIELVSFDPRDMGHVQTGNYEWRFWCPYMTIRAKELGATAYTGLVAFAAWNILRSYPASWAGSGHWPAIQTLAHTCAASNRAKILGRAARTDRSRVVGALEILEKERLVWVTTRGDGPYKVYVFKVLDRLPLLTPNQVKKLPPTLQERHDQALGRAQIQLQQWEQMTLPTLIPDGEVMSGT